MRPLIKGCNKKILERNKIVTSTIRQVGKTVSYKTFAAVVNNGREMVERFTGLPDIVTEGLIRAIQNPKVKSSNIQNLISTTSLEKFEKEFGIKRVAVEQLEVQMTLIGDKFVKGIFA